MRMIVVPAKAGTHNHQSLRDSRALMVMGPGSRLASLGSAGTTQEQER